MKISYHRGLFYVTPAIELMFSRRVFDNDFGGFVHDITHGVGERYNCVQVYVAFLWWSWRGTIQYGRTFLDSRRTKKTNK